MMTQRQWQEVESIVRAEQVRALQHMNNKRYEELGEILNHLYDPAHCEPSSLSCKDHLTDE
jgi:hypothetical protein